MSEKLTDPNKAAHAIVATLNGKATRNDGVVLHAADTNPWYVLATIYGEQDEGTDRFNHNKDRAVKNRRAWNLLVCQDLSSDERAQLAQSTGLEPCDWAPQQDTVKAKAELIEIEKRFQTRMGEDAKLPAQSDGIDFSKNVFSRFVSFEKMIFAGAADFAFASFLGSVDFGSSTFTRLAIFNDTHFSGYADFIGTTFNRSADFHSSRFNGQADFSSTVFCGHADFGSTSFNRSVKFIGASFRGSTSFKAATFNNSATFNSSTFGGEIAFVSAKFKSTTRFKEARFLTCVPKFHGVELHDDTVFSTPRNYWERWPPLKGEVSIKGRGVPLKVMSAGAQKRAYNRLRLFMNRSLQIDEEQFFHRMEMRCKRETEGWQYRWIYTLFEGASDYGNSVLRPAGWLFVVWLSGAIAKLGAVSGGWWPDWHSIPSAMGWSFANLFSFFGFYRRYFYNENLNGIQELFGATQTVLGFVLLFMLGLGLRNRFRLR